MTVPVHCPHCNATVPLTAVPPSHRVTCPRCGEPFPVKAPADADAPQLPAESLNGPPVTRPLTGHGNTQRSVAPFALVGVALAGVVLVVGWYVFLRNPSGPPPDATRPTKSTATVPPPALAALSYLPADTNVLIVAQPGPLIAFAERTQADPKQVLARAGLPQQVQVALDRLGLKPEQIDHIAVGLAVTHDGVLPRFFVALHLNAPLADRTAVLRQLKAVQMTVASGATRYKTDLGLPLGTEMANPDPTTYLFATDGRDLDEQPKPRGGAHLPAGLRESLGRLSPSSCVWVATDSAKWAERPATLAAAALLQRPELPARLASVRAVALGTSLEPQLKVTTAVRWADADAAKRFQDRVANSLADRPVQIGGDGPWVTVEGAADGDVWGGLLELLPAGKK